MFKVYIVNISIIKIINVNKIMDIVFLFFGLVGDIEEDENKCLFLLILVPFSHYYYCRLYDNIHIL